MPKVGNTGTWPDRHGAVTERQAHYEMNNIPYWYVVVESYFLPGTTYARLEQEVKEDEQV